MTEDQQLTLAVLSKCRKLINMIRKSSILTLYFNKQSETLKITRNLLRDICIRWNYSYMMIDSLIIVRPIIDKLYHDRHYLDINCNQIEKLNRLEITSGGRNHLKYLHHVLQVFYYATKLLSGSAYPSMGSAYFILAKLKNFLINNSNNNMTVQNLKKLLLSKMIYYFEEDRIQLDLLKVSKKQVTFSYC